ncbi:MAG: glycoside hydrolase family 2 TIM barrel-domain containing protein [Candidatus Omnitrophota bacterium]|jgi:beta-glucuronidase
MGVKVRGIFLSVLIITFLTCPLVRGVSWAEVKPLFDPGTEEIVDYAKYGEFKGVGTEQYKYEIKDRKGLSAAVGEGIYPSTSVYKDPGYREAQATGKMTGSQWEFVNYDDQVLTFYKWATASEEPGVKLHYTAVALAKAGYTIQAIKAHYAVLVNFPKSVGWTFWHTPLYISKMSLNELEYLTRTHPELGIKLEDAKITIENSYDNEITNDKFIINPGKLVKVKPEEVVPAKADLSKLKAVKTVGGDHVKLVKFENGHWQLQVDGKPFPMKAMAYSPNKIGLSPDNGSLNVQTDWMTADFNKNGKVDGPYDAYVDVNKNNKQDAGEAAVGDFQLMKDMGVNTIRLYHHSTNKDLLKDGYEKYGFMYLMGDFLGMYAAGSGAEWYSGTDYTNPEHQKKMMESVRQVVEEYKDEPYILMWVLGNENNYGFPGTPEVEPGMGCRAKIQPDAYYAFVNEVAKMIKSVDPKHPVAICNGETVYLNYFAKHCPDVDVFGANVYRGPNGFGRTYWEDVKDLTDRPSIITEYGCPSYVKDNPEKGEHMQALYHKGNWEDIEFNMAGSGFGNALGGVCFEWVDEWWKAGPPPQLDPAKQEWEGWDYKAKTRIPGNFRGPFPDGWLHEEYLGVASQGDGAESPFIRQLKESYFWYKENWTK